MNTGIVPQCYKLSHIAPLYKKGSKAIAANYRPVSLTSHIVKIYERILRKTMVDHLERNNLLCQNQYGFRKGKSCLTQLLHHLDDVINSLLSGKDVDAIYLNYAKAFDNVDHRLLLMKLRHYGFSEKMVEWIKSFLSNRYQKVVIDGRVTFLALILSGVPQATVLGPILFLVFINDITTCVLTSTIRCFADDTRVCKAVSSCQDVSDLQKDLENIISWSDCKNMMLHLSSSKQIQLVALAPVYINILRISH